MDWSWAHPEKGIDWSRARRWNMDWSWARRGKEIDWSRARRLNTDWSWAHPENRDWSRARLGVMDWSRARLIKEDSVFLSPPLTPGEQYLFEVTALGIVFAHVRVPATADGYQLVWRHTEKRQRNAIVLAEALTAPLVTARAAAGVVGLCIWDLVIRHRPLFEMQPPFEALNDVRPDISLSRRAWDFRVPIKARHRATLFEACKSIDASDVIYPPRIGTHNVEILIASDASSFAAGGVLCRNPSRGFFIRRFDQKLLVAHIYLKELTAALWTLELLLRPIVIKGTTVILFVDNTAVMYALRRMHSSNAEAVLILRRIHALVTELSITLVVERVSSVMNPSDEPSRGFYP